MSLNRNEHTAGLLHKIKFYCVYGKTFFLINHFLVEEDYELSKSTCNLLSVSLTLDASEFCLNPSLFFYFNCLPDDDLCKII